MAWTEQAWRYSLGGLADPEQGLDEQQTHLSLVWTANASDLYEFTALEFTQAEALSLQGIPDGDSGLTYTTRAAIGHVAAIGFSDSTSRDGAVDATLDSFTPDFDGTITIPAFDGDLTVTIGDFAVSFVADFAYRHWFEASYALTPTWVATEHPARFGDVAITLSGFSTSIEGYALPPDSTQGALTPTMSGFTPALAGTYTAPQSYDGSVSLDIETFAGVFLGTSIPDTGVLGAFAVSLDEYTTAFSGTFEVWNTDGDLTPSVSAFTVSIEGAFIDASAVSGLVTSTMSSFTPSFVGALGVSGIRGEFVEVPSRSRLAVVSPRNTYTVVQ